MLPLSPPVLRKPEFMPHYLLPGPKQGSTNQEHPNLIMAFPDLVFQGLPEAR